MIERECLHCQKPFQVPYPSSKRKCCSPECTHARKLLPRATRTDKGARKSKWVQVECPECGHSFEVPPHRVRLAKRHGSGRIFCSERCYQKQWAEGKIWDEAKKPIGRRPRGTTRFLDAHGYVQIYVTPDERPPGCEKRTNLPEHRIVMARHLGRHLLPHETVHHKNGDKQDNRIENLELWSRNHSDGQRVADKLAWAREIISTYEPIEDLIK
jgi:hypothetical protein